MSDTVAGTSWRENVNQAKAATSAADRKAQGTLDKDAFLQLLVTQLRYQDPLSPMDDKQFIAQMAQFTSLEQMQNMNKSFQLSQSYNMIGKFVYTSKFNSMTGKSDDWDGVVSGVIIKNGNPYLRIRDKDVSLDDVYGVGEGSDIAGGIESIFNTTLNTQNLSLMGRYVQALLLDEKGNAKEFVEGKVDYVKYTGSTPILVVGDKEIYAYEVTSVADEKLLLDKKITVSEKDADGNYTDVVENGTISGVNVKEGKAYLVIGGKDYLINKINYASEAIRLVGKEVSYKDTTGVASAAVLRDGNVYLKVGEELVSYADLRGK